MSVTPWKACVLQSFLTVTTERKTNEATAANYLAWLHFLSVGLTSVGFFFFSFSFYCLFRSRADSCAIVLGAFTAVIKIKHLWNLDKKLLFNPSSSWQTPEKKTSEKSDFFFLFWNTSCLVYGLLHAYTVDKALPSTLLFTQHCTVATEQSNVDESLWLDTFAFQHPHWVWRSANANCTASYRLSESRDKCSEVRMFSQNKIWFKCYVVLFDRFKVKKLSIFF